jgi:acyl-coenzyme A thioesterase PaaI-like protein
VGRQQVEQQAANERKNACCSTNFVRAVRDGAVLAATRPLYKGRTIIVLESELTREDDALVAKVTQTQAFHYPRA